MRPVKSLCAGLLAASLLALSPASRAQSIAPHYVGVGVGQSTYLNSCIDAAAFVGLRFDRCENTDGAFKVFVGERRKHFGVEFALADIGKVSANYLVQSLEWKTFTLDILLVGYIPITPRLSVLGKLGATNWYMEASKNWSGLNSTEEYANGFSGTYALGLQFDISDRVGLRADWQHYSNIGNENTTGQFDVDVVSAGVLFTY